MLRGVKWCIACLAALAVALQYSYIFRAALVLDRGRWSALLPSIYARWRQRIGADASGRDTFTYPDFLQLLPVFHVPFPEPTDLTTAAFFRELDLDHDTFLTRDELFAPDNTAYNLLIGLDRRRYESRVAVVQSYTADA